ncbi:response regulator [Spirosoma terrae]|uniref:Response regulator n=1 Tax=Spirosoma terrae TaxID=1968276 RepID=A0A6L9LDY7_9BACT|nr:response regulator [Spirosoma terrae]NDU94939.1 response regulator [Spirosoma terrae]
MHNLYGPETTIRRSFRGASILLIDDNPDQCDLIRTVLKGCIPEIGFQVAVSGEEAFRQLRHCQALKQQLPSLILLDLYLPFAEDGLRFVEQIKRKDSPYRLIPLTLLSYSAKHQDVLRGYELGANSYIVKPTDHAQWLQSIQSLRAYWWNTVTLPLG